MATIAHLVQAGKLTKLDPELEWNEKEWRWIFVLPPVIARIQKDLPTWQSQWDQTISPNQQFDALFEVFCSGETLAYGHQFKSLTHLGSGVWELKTPDTRFFGWFAQKDVFIGCALDEAFKVKTHGLYAGYAGQVVHLRNGLDLDEPKFIKGDNPNDVVSNYD